MAAPRGDGTRPDEVKGNSCTLWLAKSLRLLSEAGKLFLFENQAPDGIYPKVWDDPDMQHAIATMGQWGSHCHSARTSSALQTSQRRAIANTLGC